MCRQRVPQVIGPTTENSSQTCCDDIVDYWNDPLTAHRRSQGVQWVHLHPQGGDKNFSGLIYRKKCESAPPARAKSQFLGQFLLGGLDLEVYLDGL